MGHIGPVLIVFVMLALPFAVWQLTANSDEPRYTLAAARMMATGDYLVPYSAWGEVRLLKPPLTYYYVVAGMGLFGQSAIAVKSFWLLSGALILAATYALARSAGAGRQGAGMAVAALAANLLFFQSALTHNPDIPMTLGLTLALVGFARLSDGQPPPVWAYFAAWLGLGWAFLAKGLLAIVLAAVALLLRMALRYRRDGRLFVRPAWAEVLAIVGGLIVGGWWHVALALRAPDALAAQFLGDQVAQKVAFGLTDYAAGAAFFALALIIGFLPALIAAPMRRGAMPRRTVPLRRGVIALLIAWSVVCVLVFAFSNFRVGRYMLPAMPAMAVLIGLGFDRLAPSDVARRCGRAVRLSLVLAAIVAGLSAAILWMAGQTLGMLAWLALAAALIAGLWWLAGRAGPRLAPALLAGALPTAVLFFLPGYLTLGIPSAADLALREIRAGGYAPAEVLVLRRWHLVERVGLRAPPLQDYVFASRPDPQVLAQARIVISVPPVDADALRAAGWQVQILHGAPERFGLDDFISAVRARDVDAFRARFGEPLLVARLPNAPLRRQSD